MANDNEVKFTAKIEDDVSPALENLSAKSEELAESVDAASKSIEQLEGAQQNASSAADNAAQANESLSNANADTSASAENSAQAAEEEAQAKDKAAKSAENLAQKQQKAAGGTNILQSALSRLKDGFALDVVIGNLVTKGIELAINAFKNLGEAVVDCVYQFADAEMISARLEASLRNQGITSAYVTQELNDYAQSMQTVYGVSDDVIKNGMRLLVNFGVIGDELKQATNSAYALSQGLGIDVQSAFQMVARAAEGNVTALSRYGIKVDTSKTQSEQFAQALEQIDNKFGALAGASANNLITKTNALKESWGDFKEQVGAAFEPLAQIVVNLLTKGVQGLQSAFRFLTDTLNILVESGVQGFNYVSLAVLKTKETIQELGLKTLEFRNAIGLASDEAVSSARANLEATQAEIGRKKEQIELFRQSTQYLESERDALAANSAESKKAAEEQIAAAQKRMEAERLAEEAKKQAEEEAKKRAEKEAQEAENRAKRVSDFKFQTHMDYLNNIAEIEKAQSGYEQAEIMARVDQDYQAKRTALENQIEYLAEHNANDINARIELEEEMKALDEEYGAYHAQIQEEQNNGKIRANALDKFLADERVKNARASLDIISQLSNAKTKELATIGKAAAVAQATINTYEGATKALAQGGIAGPAMAALVTAVGMMNVAKIMGVEFAVGTPNIPQDMVATVHQGEIIVPKTFAEGLRDGDLMLGSTENLFEQQTNNAHSTNINNTFNFNGDVLADSTDSIAEKLGQTMSESIAGGRMAPFPTGERM